MVSKTAGAPAEPSVNVAEFAVPTGVLFLIFHLNAEFCVSIKQFGIVPMRKLIVVDAGHD